MKINKNKLYIVLISIMSYVIYIILYGFFKGDAIISDDILFVLSWIGIMCVVYFIYKWYKITKKVFTLYNVFLMFFLVFNFGQCLLWAFGIHSEKEIGTNLLYNTIPCSNEKIAIAQIIFIICFITLNCGAILVYHDKKNVKKEDINSIEVKYRNKSLFYASVIISMIAIPATIYTVIRNYLTASIYGYKSLYYGDNVIQYAKWVQISVTLFLPSLLGLLIGSNYNKKIRRFVYIVFSIYVFFSLMCGDRGEWIMKLIILFWADNEFYKRIKPKKMLLMLLAGYLGIYIMNAIVSLRNIGISYEGIKMALFGMENNPIVSLLLEFGNSMSVNIVTANSHIEFPYGNTYIMSILTMFTTSVARWFNIEYIQLHTWFSSDYLRISYGADFTIIGEAILNYGMYISPIFMGLLGAIISKICFLSYDKNKPLLTCLSLNCIAHIFKWSRTTTWFVINGIIYSVVVFGCAYICMVSILKRKKSLDE